MACRVIIVAYDSARAISASTNDRELPTESPAITVACDAATPSKPDDFSVAPAVNADQLLLGGPNVDLYDPIRRDDETLRSGKSQRNGAA